MKIKLHKYQLQAMLSEKRIVACVAGLQSGKTTVGALWLRKMISYTRDPEASFIVCFPTYKICVSSTLPALMKYNSELGYLIKSDYIFQCHHGPKIFLRSLDNCYSLEGITGCRGAWIDEGGLVSTQSWINLQGRLAPKQAPCIISTTPYNLTNFLYRDLYQPWLASERDDIEFIQWTSEDNPHFPAEEYERQRKLLDPRIFALRYQGRFERMVGLVYADFDHYNYCDPFKIDKAKYFVVGGSDFGIVHPFACVVRAISRDGQHDYQITEYKCTGLTPEQQAQTVKQIHTKFKVDWWVGDPGSDGGMCSLCASLGVPMRPIKKGAGSIQMGIGLHQEIIRTKCHQLFRGLCEETAKELETYSYPQDKEGKSPDENPLKYHDDLMDATRYVTMATSHIRAKAFAPYQPAKTHLQKLLGGDYKKVSVDDW